MDGRREMSRKAVYAVLTIVCFVSGTVGGLGAQGPMQTPGAIQQLKGPWQTPGPIQQPTGPWLQPREFQQPGEIQSVKEGCQQRLTVGADTLFAFNEARLSPAAEATLNTLGPMIQQAGRPPMEIAGHTDALGSAAYNQQLSEARARAVKAWLVAHQYVPDATPITGYGKRHPVAPNTTPDGRDNPDGRQRNRRVEVVIDTCR
jgi:outer membrane protein OmpA-like peptidoglycan-associated protein